jgi:holo-[acyl-carrier protein] synthase
MKRATQILGIGTDIIEIERIAMAIKRHGSHFIDRIFTVNEQQYAQKFSSPETAYAGRFAAKEAISKALGTGITVDVGWKDMEIVNSSSGKPLVVLSQALQTKLQNSEILISISHCKEYATAFAIWNGFIT